MTKIVLIAIDSDSYTVTLSPVVTNQKNVCVGG